MKSQFVARRTLTWEDGHVTFQWISLPGRKVVHYGRPVPRLSYTAKLTQDQALAHVFTTKAQARVQIHRYYGWIEKQFEIVKL